MCFKDIKHYKLITSAASNVLHLSKISSQCEQRSVLSGTTCFTVIYTVLFCKLAWILTKCSSLSPDFCCPHGLTNAPGINHRPLCVCWQSLANNLNNNTGFMVYIVVKRPLCFCSIYNFSSLTRPEAIKSNITISLCGQKSRAIDCSFFSIEMFIVYSNSTAFFCGKEYANWKHILQEAVASAT